MLMKLMKFPDFKGERQVSSAPVLPSSREAKIQPDSMVEHPKDFSAGAVWEESGSWLQAAGPGRTVAPVALTLFYKRY